MGGKTWDEWIDDYSESHQNTINQLTHKIGIPMIALSLLLIPTCLFCRGFLANSADAVRRRLDFTIYRTLF